MIDIHAASREWKNDGNWVIAPAGLAWIKEGARASIGEGARIGDKSSGAIDLGFAEGYRKCIAEVDGVAYIGAGCRWFTLADAIKHWSSKEGRDITNCLMMSAIHIAAIKGWASSHDEVLA
jgi:hypothetical protein